MNTMNIPKYKASVKLSNKLEQDHYSCARDYFKNSGTSEKHIKDVKTFFKDYDEVKEDMIEQMRSSGKISEQMIEQSDQFTAERALELIDVALADHKKENNGKTKSSSWRRA